MQTNINYLVNGANPSTVGGTGTAIKYFPNNPGPSIGVSNTTPSATSAAGQLPVPGANKLNGQQFRVYATGALSVAPGISCPNITIALYANTGTVASPTYTAIATTGAVAAGNFDNESWKIEALLNGDTLSGVLQGQYSAIFNNVLVNSTPKVITALSGLNYATDPVFGLVVGVTFSVSAAANSAFMYQFVLES
jgi:hypothetical protein